MRSGKNDQFLVHNSHRAWPQLWSNSRAEEKTGLPSSGTVLMAEKSDYWDFGSFLTHARYAISEWFKWPIQFTRWKPHENTEFGQIASFVSIMSKNISRIFGPERIENLTNQSCSDYAKNRRIKTKKAYSINRWPLKSVWRGDRIRHNIHIQVNDMSDGLNIILIRMPDRWKSRAIWPRYHSNQSILSVSQEFYAIETIIGPAREEHRTHFVWNISRI